MVLVVASYRHAAGPAECFRTTSGTENSALETQVQVSSGSGEMPWVTRGSVVVDGRPEAGEWGVCMARESGGKNQNAPIWCVISAKNTFTVRCAHQSGVLSLGGFFSRQSVPQFPAISQIASGSDDECSGLLHLHSVALAKVLIQIIRGTQCPISTTPLRV